MMDGTPLMADADADAGLSSSCNDETDELTVSFFYGAARPNKKTRRHTSVRPRLRTRKKTDRKRRPGASHFRTRKPKIEEGRKEGRKERKKERGPPRSVKAPQQVSKIKKKQQQKKVNFLFTAAGLVRIHHNSSSNEINSSFSRRKNREIHEEKNQKKREKPQNASRYSTNG